MKYKYLLKVWLLTSAVAFLLYELLWRIAAFTFFPFGNWGEVCFDFLYCALFTLSSLGISEVLSRRRFFCHLTSARQMLLCLLTLTLNLGVAFCFEKMYDWLMPAPNSEFFWHSYYMFCVTATLLTLVHATSHYGMMVIRQKNELTELQKKALKSQLDPHFVFNSLSTLAELIRQNPVQAEDYVIRLSRVYRYILSHLEHDYASLPDSIKFIKDYVALQQLRLPGEIVLRMGHMQERENECLFPLSLQLLVENAVKHNFPEEGERLLIDIEKEGNTIVLSNSKEGASPHAEAETENKQGMDASFGIGLESLRKRYELEGMPQPQCRMQNGRFEVRMRIINPAPQKEEK